ncbi:hypothetical protein [Peribacillus sp. SCS-155]|uniref:hypothetical protein n=1 Tax=Peribacillus sedimenti TaxID=3115297 RepID=UPI0039068CFE
MQKLSKLHILCLAVSFTVFFLYLIYLKTIEPTRETVMFFPIDTEVEFNEATTKINVIKDEQSGYSLYWRVRSLLDRKAYLRQDLSILYKNGRMAGLLKDWHQYSTQVDQEKSIHERQSSIFKAISFHYAELHPSSEIYKSAHEMTADHLYVIASPFSKFQSFQRPSTKEQKEWKLTLDNVTSSLQAETLEAVSAAYRIDTSMYRVFPLTSLNETKGEIFKHFSPSLQQELMSKLWEGIYKNYILGITINKGPAAQSPIGSTEPLLLVRHDNREVLVITLTKAGTPVLLRQRLPTHSSSILRSISRYCS